MPQERVLNGAQLEFRVCPYCHATFEPKRLRQEFCGDKCRIAYHKDVGTEGEVAAITHLKRGRVSVVMHFDSGTAAERVKHFVKGERRRVV
jgi:hypothetical protein